MIVRKTKSKGAAQPSGASAGRDLHTELMDLNMGPSHPAMHGTVRMKLSLDGETVVKCDPEVGYLHRGMEKMSENRTYAQCLPYTDRLNYVSPLINNVGFVLTLEKLLRAESTPRADYIRVIISELSRITDHFTAIAASALELGGFTPMLWGVEARDHLYNLIEDLTGARLTVNYVRVGGVKADLPADFHDNWLDYREKILHLHKDIDAVLTTNGVFLDRNDEVGAISREDAIEHGFTGVVLRSTGEPYDVRRAHPYLGYDTFEWDVVVGTSGDNLDRYLCRMEEILQSAKIIDQCFEAMEPGPIISKDWAIALPEKGEVYHSIEGMIAHFETIMKGIEAPPGEVYGFVEGGNGELGFYMVSDGKGGPYRLHVRPPCFAFMQGLHLMVEGGMLADIIPTFDSINMIGGEIDR